MSSTDLDLIRKMVQPLADQFGLIGRGLIGKLGEETIGRMYERVGEEGVRQAADAIVRIGKAYLARRGGGDDAG